MISHPEYHTPSETVSTVTEVKKSRFIATITPVTAKEEALSFFQKIRDHYSGANHNCFAYIIGNPKSAIDIGCGDDGEPSGTAGKPMLGVLQHNNIGDVAVMVTRFFGGTKLGTGGLVRAYSAAVKMAVEKVSLNEFIQSSCMQISIPFEFESNVRHLLATLNLTVIDSEYSENVLIKIDVPERILDSVQKKVNDITRGVARF